MRLQSTIACVLMLSLYAGNVFAQQQNNYAKTNQLGFYPESQKLAISPSSSATTFFIKEVESGTVVYFGTLENGGLYNLSGETVKVADFTDFTRQGEFILTVEGVGASFPFEIKNDLYDGLNDALIKAMYFNRASAELEEEHAGEWSRPAGHADTNVLIHSSAATTNRPEGSSISSPGGWYDAGDFNKYVVPISSSINHMLFAYERFPDYYSNRELTIPESGDAVPDILDEAKYALDWLLTMQDPDDGGVYHKLTHANFQATIMPHQANNPRYVVQKGTAATLDFAAVMAQAARVFEPFYPNFSTTALQAAIDAFAWAQANPNISYNQGAMNSNHDPDINTGAYGDSNFSDEFFWARAELYVTTGDDQYYPDNGWNGVGVSSWPGVQALGLFSLLHHRQSLTAMGLADTTSMKNTLINAFSWYVDDAQNAPYRSPFGLQSWQFGWGSNGGAGNLGMGIMLAYELTGDQKYFDGAIHVMDYIMGRNPVAYSYVTGFGTQSPMHIHHRQSEADNVVEPIPGWVAGGANPGNQSQDCGASAYSSSLPALSYLDDYCSYSTNEITTYWNSPFVYVTAGLEVYSEDVISEGEPTLKITSPIKDTVMDAGEALPITWDAPSISTVDISYRLFSESSFTEIASNVDASLGSFSGFTTPDIPGDSLVFKIENSSDDSEFSYSPILYIKREKSIRSVTAEARFNLPFTPGLTITISWDAIEFDSLNLHYYLASNTQLEIIAEQLPGNQTEYTQFQIPESDGDTIYFRLSDPGNPEFYLDSPGYEIPTTVNSELEEQPINVRLEQNYPNPFNPSTEIGFSLNKSGFVNLTVYDITGKKITTLVNELKPEGRHQVRFDASLLSSGIYFYRLKSDSFDQIRKMLLMK